ncbi:hypothetical protein PUN28_005035 [Cardiocondyla obscurior]
MGKIYSKLTRPIRTFNIENRAERVISREKPIPAPQYATTEKQKKLADKVNPHFMEDHYRKNVQLDQRLKDVFVTSTDPEGTKESKKESGLLPQNRHSWENEFLYESFESIVIPAGKCSLKQALSFILQHKTDPTTYNSEHIASEYNLDKKVVDDILKYFKPYVNADTPPMIEPDDEIQKLVDLAIKLKKEKNLQNKK